MQSNQDIIKLTHDKDHLQILPFHIIDNSIWDTFLNLIISKKGEKIEEIQTYAYHIGAKYNIDKRNIIKDFCNYIIRNKPNMVTKEFLSFVENIIHSQNNNYYSINYLISHLGSFVNK
jgi:hypothetical protein